MNIRDIITLIESKSADRDQILIDYLKNDAIDIRSNWHLFAEWAVHYGEGSGELVERLSKLSGVDLSDESYEGEAENIMGIDPALYHKLPKKVRQQFEKESERNLSDAGKSPTRRTFSLMSDQKLPSDTLLVHFTNNPEEILRNGFVKGVSDIELLDATVRLPQEMKENPGYNFAYFADGTHFNLQNGSWKRTHAVLFRHTGVHVIHHGDREEQVIFWGPYVPVSAIIEIKTADEFLS